MPVIPIALRGLVWLVSGLGLGSMFGGDSYKIERQEIIKQSTTGEKIIWIVLTVATLGLLTALAIYFYKQK